MEPRSDSHTTHTLTGGAAVPSTEITALLGRGTRFDGKLHFEGRVRIDGVFKGEIKSDDTLVIGDGAEVNAEIDVGTVIVRGGIVHGNIRAKNAIEIHAPGKLVGNIQSPSLFIDRGVEFQGTCRMDPVDTAGAPAVAAEKPAAKINAGSGANDTAARSPAASPSRA
jgi:cytoskeletal protein CcmA (bactofilin family)